MALAQSSNLGWAGGGGGAGGETAKYAVFWGCWHIFVSQYSRVIFNIVEKTLSSPQWARHFLLLGENNSSIIHQGIDLTAGGRVKVGGKHRGSRRRK